MRTSSPSPRSVPLPVQPDLDHRGEFGSAGTPLFPPVGTLEAVGGREVVARLVDGLYDRIEADALLRPAFNPDLTSEREKLKEFFEVWFEGEPSPMFDGEWRHELKRTHERIKISRGIADRWVAHFFDSFAEAGAGPDLIERIRPLICRHARALVNRPDEPAPGENLRRRCSGVEMQHWTRLVQRDDAEGIAAAAGEHAELPIPQGSTLLLIAALRGKARAAEALLHRGVNANEPAALPGGEASLHGLPTLRIAPLCGALVKRRDAVVKLLVEYGAQYDIFTAAFVGDAEAVREILDRAPELADARDPACDLPRITPLIHAVYGGQLEVARLLLERGASVGVNGAKLLQGAADAGHEALTELLLEHGAEPASIAIGPWVSHVAIADKFVARGANVNAHPARWIWFCCTGNSGHRENVPLARGLLRCGADVAAQYRGRSALHHAAKAGFTRVVEAIIEHGGDVNAPDDRGRTPLDAVKEAARSIDREPVRRILVAHGGRRAIDRAVTRDDGRVV